MKRNAGAQGSEGKLESRFAALTSGLLARKGFAAPSNSPIADPAEETDAFALEPTRKAEKKKDAAPQKPAPKAQADPVKPAAKPQADAVKPATPPAAPPKKEAAAPAPAPAKKPEPAPKHAEEMKLRAQDRAAPEPIKVINERSIEAGYPDNPTPEEIAALEAEADEVVSYFENFGSDDALENEKNDFYGDGGDVLDELDDLDDLDDLEDEADDAGVPRGSVSAGPWAGASVPAVKPQAAFEVRAGVTVQLTPREFMRLSLGAAETGQSAQDLIAEALEEYLDARGVLSLGGCSCLEALTKKPGGA